MTVNVERNSVRYLLDRLFTVKSDLTDRHVSRFLQITPHGVNNVNIVQSVTLKAE